MNKELLGRLERLEIAKNMRTAVEVWDLYTMPDGREIKTQDMEEGKRLEALGGRWDLLIIVRDKGA